MLSIRPASIYPGTGTPTTILLCRNRSPVSAKLRVIRGIRGESAPPNDPAGAPVWSEILRHLDEAPFDGKYVSVAEAERTSFHHHPWSIGGGSAAELKLRFDDAGALTISAAAADYGVAGMRRS